MLTEWTGSSEKARGPKRTDDKGQVLPPTTFQAVRPAEASLSFLLPTPLGLPGQVGCLPLEKCGPAFLWLPTEHTKLSMVCRGHCGSSQEVLRAVYSPQRGSRDWKAPFPGPAPPKSSQGCWGVVELGSPLRSLRGRGSVRHCGCPQGSPSAVLVLAREIFELPVPRLYPLKADETRQNLTLRPSSHKNKGTGRCVCRAIPAQGS